MSCLLLLTIFVILPSLALAAPEGFPPYCVKQNNIFCFGVKNGVVSLAAEGCLTDKYDPDCDYYIFGERHYPAGSRTTFWKTLAPSRIKDRNFDVLVYLSKVKSTSNTKVGEPYILPEDQVAFSLLNRFYSNSNGEMVTIPSGSHNVFNSYHAVTTGQGYAGYFRSPNDWLSCRLNKFRINIATDYLYPNLVIVSKDKPWTFIAEYSLPKPILLFAAGGTPITDVDPQPQTFAPVIWPPRTTTTTPRPTTPSTTTNRPTKASTSKKRRTKKPKTTTASTVSPSTPVSVPSQSSSTPSTALTTISSPASVGETTPSTVSLPPSGGSVPTNPVDGLATTEQGSAAIASFNNKLFTGIIVLITIVTIYW